MTPNAYRAAIERLGLSQVGAGEFLGASERTSRRWASEGAPRSVELALTYRIALLEAREMVAMWGDYADDYFKGKWGFADDLAKLDAVLNDPAKP